MVHSSSPSSSLTSSCNASLGVALVSACPGSSWRDALAPALYRPRMTFVNAGANKGFAVAEFLQRFSDDGTSPSYAEWFGNLSAIKPTMHLKCGFCQVCEEPPPRRRLRARHVSVHAFELLKANHLVLQLMFAPLQRPHRRLLALHRALTDEARAAAGVVYTPSSFRTGQENTQVALRRREPRAAAVNCTTLDASLADAREEPSEGARRGARGAGGVAPLSAPLAIDWLLLDAEGC